MKTSYKWFDHILLILLFLVAINLLAVSAVRAAVVASDGGITLWISYDNLDVADADIDDTITEADVLPGGFSCTATNTGRSDVGAANSPPSCPGGTGSCTAREKITGDLEKLADYIFQGSEGAHYLRHVYVSDNGRAWNSADIKWNMGVGGSSAPGGGWANPDSQMNMQSTYRTCIHDVAHHELGHYFYNLPDRYANSSGYYQGTIDGGPAFQVNVTARDVNTVMSNNFPHRFVDTTNAQLTVDYDQPGPGSTTGEVLTPDLLTDGDATNDGPDRAHHGHTMPFAQDEWSLLPTRHADLTGVHTEGSFPDGGVRPDVNIVFIGDDEIHPGFVLLLDRSGSMGVTTNGITAAQFVQEAGMYLYHSSEAGDMVGTYLYNEDVEELFPYAAYDAANDLPFASFRNASGLTDIAKALKTAIDELIDTHGEGGVSGAEIYLMSDGKQTTGDSLWDQVTRANERGIRINTFSFGDADATTMDGIASGSSGASITMSERDDAAELKMIMARKFSTGRGKTPVYAYKGPMEDRINLGATQIWVGQFEVPPKSRDLQFYIFLHAGDASKTMAISLTDPDGNSFAAPAPDNVANKGRFNGMKLDAPKPGLWSYQVAGIPGSGLPDEDVEVSVYVENRELKGMVWFDDFTEDDILPVHAQLTFRYPLTNITANAKIYSMGQLVTTVPMVDDGTNGDVQHKDGVYSALVNLSDGAVKELLHNVNTKTNKLRVEVDFKVTEASIPAPLAHYETGTTPEMLQQDYATNVSAFSAWGTGVINLNDRDQGDSEDPKLDVPGFGGSITVAPGNKVDVAIKVINARPLLDQFRVTVGSGAKVDVESQPATDPDQLGQSYTLTIDVDADAKPGGRDLVVQFGDILLVWPELIDITEAVPDNGDGEDGGVKGDDNLNFILLVLLVVLLIAVFLIVMKKKSNQQSSE